MSVDLEKLIKDQGRLLDWIAKVVINYKKLPKAKVNSDMTKRRLDQLKTEWEKARTLHSTIDYEATRKDRETLSYFVQDHYSKAEDAFEEAADFLVTELGKFTKASTSVRADDTNSIVQDAKPSLSQLPRINLPRFSGVISEWKGFRNTFKEMIDSNQGITNTLKFHYLRSCLSGVAANLIINLAPSEDNYSTAWTILTDEYDDKRALIRAHAKTILCFPPMKTENLAELKRFRDTVAAARSALANLGSPVDQLDHLLVSSMELKLSPVTAREWNKNLGKSKEFASYAQLHEFLTI